MGYRYSRLDHNNIDWMKNDLSRRTLRRIRLTSGKLRGLNAFDMSMTYPITAIAGENGSGKSTLLAIAACAYHNTPSGYKSEARRNAYYTFSDFFIQSRHETPPEGIEIWYEFLHNRWRGGEVGPRWQARRKKVGGKWNNYNSRVRRNVIYCGIQRAVPHYERSTHKSYHGHFWLDTLDEAHRQEICAIAGRIIGKTYHSFEKHTHSKYSLPIATSGTVRYSGFNMGAGEGAVFEILSSLFSSGKGSMLIIDELELGLHEQAQMRAIEELKVLCEKLHCQIICSTHSHVVLEALPPEGRFFLEATGNRTTITPGISASHACGKLRGKNIGELSLFVEDNVAAMLLQLGLPHSLRQRVNILPIGSADALLRLMASRYLETRDNFICVLDGDKRNRDNKNKSGFRKYAETKFRESEEEMKLWADKHITYLPSNTTPEKWLICSCHEIENKAPLAMAWGIEDIDLINEAFARALGEANHREFHMLSDEIHLPEERVIGDLVRFLLRSTPNALMR